MKIRITVEIDEFTRRAFGYRGGVDGVPKRIEIMRHLEAELDTLIDDIVADYERFLRDADPDAEQAED